MSSLKIKAEFPKILQGLFKPHRYKVLKGGRGGAKSWGIARALLIQGFAKPLRVLCAREFQSSIADSVHELLSNQIADLGLASFYEVGRQYIRGSNGTKFSFEGLRHNITGIKSFEGADIVWVEEAQTVSKSSWDILIPTIRKEGSEIWISFNPELESDETYQRFVVNPPKDSLVITMNWRDNPWFPDVLRQEMEDLKERDYDAYLNVWEGHCRQVLEGAIYANEIRQATEEGRFCSVPYDQSKPVSVFFDLGRADSTSVWFAQQVGFEFRVIDHYSNRGVAWSHYLKVLSERPYAYGTVWLPHDADHKILASENTIKQQTQAAGYNVQIVPMLSVEEGINSVRTIFNRCWFDSTKCADGLHSLRHYRYDVDSETKEYSRRPLHDWASHDADALRYLAIGMTTKRKQTSSEPLKYRNRRIC